MDASLLTITIAAFGGYIAWRQWRTAELKRKQDLFGKRFDLYKEIVDIIEHQNISPHTLSNLHSIKSKTLFLFGDDIRLYLEDLLNKLYQLHDKSKNHEKVLLDFEYEYFVGLEDAFAKYLQIERNFGRYAFMDWWRLHSINWRRGLFRMWLIASAFWIIGMGWHQYGIYDWAMPGQPLNKMDFIYEWKENFLYIIFPPLLIPLLFFIASWIKRGFKAEMK